MGLPGINLMTYYNLEEVFTRFHFATKSRDAFSIGVNCSQNLGCGCHPIAWVRSFFEETYKVTPLSYSANTMIDAFVGLAPFLSSLNNRPDRVVLRKFRGWDPPIFMLEIHSRILYHIQQQMCLSSYDYCGVLIIPSKSVWGLLSRNIRFEARPYPLFCFKCLSLQEVRKMAGAFGLGHQLARVDTLDRMLKNRNSAHIILPWIVNLRFHMNYLFFQHSFHH